MYFEFVLCVNGLHGLSMMAGMIVPEELKLETKISNLSTWKRRSPHLIG